MKKAVIRRYHVAIAIVIALFVGIVIGNLNITHFSERLPALPLPEVTDGQRGELGIDKNINESTIDKYLGRTDSVYIDVRMLDDPANYEAIDGDSKLSGLVKGFEVVPYPYLVNVVGLPKEVGETYTGKTLFTQNDKGEYSANYKESMTILEDLFPKDKNIFLMCGGGGYSGMAKSMLVKLGWDTNKIYVVGGYWFYEGQNDFKIKNGDGKDAAYAFWKVPYHNIDFSKLTENKK
jgi:rhodanese-related sulfurtransferase